MREGETATLLKTVFGFPLLLWRRFRPTSLQTLRGSAIIRRLLLLISTLVFCGSVASVTAQPDAAKFDEFGDTCCNDEKARLDNFANQLRNEATTTATLFFTADAVTVPCAVTTEEDFLGAVRPKLVPHD